MGNANVEIHPSAVVSDEAVFEGSARVGPNCVIDGPVTIGDGVRLIASVYLKGPLWLGAGSTVYPFSSLGFPGQDLKFGPDDTSAGVVIGESCTLREGVTIHGATNDHTPTRLGDHVFMMANAHVGHDCTVGNRVIMVNNTALGGHVTVGDSANIGGGTLVHQHREIGRLAFLGGGLPMSASVPPFCMASEAHRLTGLNTVGLRRSGAPREEITKLRDAYKHAIRPGLIPTETARVIREVGEGAVLCAELADWYERVGQQIAPDSSVRPPRAVLAWLRHAKRVADAGGSLEADDE